MDGREPASIPLRSEHAGMCGQLDLRPCFYSLASPRRAALASAPGVAQSRCRCGAPPRDTRPTVLQQARTHNARTHNARTHATTHTTACTLGVPITPTRPRKRNLPGPATSEACTAHAPAALLPSMLRSVPRGARRGCPAHQNLQVGRQQLAHSGPLAKLSRDWPAADGVALCGGFPRGATYFIGRGEPVCLQSSPP